MEKFLIFRVDFYHNTDEEKTQALFDLISTPLFWYAYLIQKLWSVFPCEPYPVGINHPCRAAGLVRAHRHIGTINSSSIQPTCCSRGTGRQTVPYANVVKALLWPFPVLQPHRSYPVTIYNIMIGAQGISAPSILDASNLRIRYLAGMSGSGRLYLARRWHSPRSITLEQIWCQELQTSQAKAI